MLREVNGKSKSRIKLQGQIFLHITRRSLPIFRIIFGLKNSPGILKIFIDLILSHVLWELTYVYLYDVMIYIHSPGDNLKNGQSMIRVLMFADDRLSLKQYALLSDEVECFGHLINTCKL